MAERAPLLQLLIVSPAIPPPCGAGKSHTLRAIIVKGADPMDFKEQERREAATGCATSCLGLLLKFIFYAGLIALAVWLIKTIL